MCMTKDAVKRFNRRCFELAAFAEWKCHFLNQCSIKGASMRKFYFVL